MVRHLSGAEVASIPLHCVDPSCTRTVLCLILAAIRGSRLQKTNNYRSVILHIVENNAMLVIICFMYSDETKKAPD